jgi:Domain of unknown function (DUF4153)
MQISSSIKRFALPALIVVVYWVLLVSKSDVKILKDFYLYMPSLFFGATAILLLLERNRSRKAFTSNIIATGFCIVLFGLTQLLPVHLDSLLILFSIASGLLLFTMPFIREADNGRYYYGCYQIFMKGLQAVVVGGIFMIAASAILGLYDVLFGGGILSRIYEYTLYTALTLVGGLYFISGLPKLGELSFLQVHRFWAFLINSVLYPLFFAALALVYVYLGKLILGGTMPSNFVGSKLLILITIGYTLELIGWGVRSPQSSKLTRLTAKYFHLLVIPLLLTAFYAIYIRVGEFGLTPPRYTSLMVLAVFSIWTLYANLAGRGSYKLRNAFTLFNIFTFIVAVGYFSAASVSTRSQLQRLNSKDEKVVCGAIDYLGDKAPADIRKKHSCEGVATEANKNGRYTYLSFTNPLYGESPINIDGYKSLINISLTNGSKKAGDVEILSENKDGKYFLTIAGQVLDITSLKDKNNKAVEFTQGNVKFIPTGLDMYNGDMSTISGIALIK